MVMCYGHWQGSALKIVYFSPSKSPIVLIQGGVTYEKWPSVPQTFGSGVFFNH